MNHIQTNFSSFFNKIMMCDARIFVYSCWHLRQVSNSLEEVQQV